MRIAVLDDDFVQMQAISQTLKDVGFDVAGFARTALLISALRRDTFDLLVVDWNIPERSGLEAIRWARQNLIPTPPMLLLTSRSDDEDVVMGLDAGADDYLIRPVASEVLVARVRALLRRGTSATAAVKNFVIAGATFEALNNSVTIAQKKAVLTSKEYALALLLFQNLNRALSRPYIVAAVWGSEPDLSSRTLDMHISRVRQKLDLKPSNGYRVAPVYSYGYRLERLEKSEPVMIDEVRLN